MRKFTVVSSGSKPVPHEPYEDFLELEGRVYNLEKDMQLLINFAALAVMVGVYFGFQYYQKHISQIPGVVE